MDINKWKSVAIRKVDYDLLIAICNKKYRAPNSMISKFVNDYCEFQAKKLNISVKLFKINLLNNSNKK